MTRPIIITGGTGFVASYLAMALLERDREQKVVLFDRDQDLRRLTGFNAPQGAKRYDAVKDRITFVQGDLSLLPHVMALFDTHSPQSVFHLGALLSAGAESNPTMGFQVDLVGSWNVFEAARMYGQHRHTPPVRVLFPSTIASFGKFMTLNDQGLVPNEAVQMPTTMYGVAKASVERLGEYYSGPSRNWIDFRAVRFPSVAGASRGPGGTTVYSTLMFQEAYRDNPYHPYVAADTRLDVIYVKDAVAALLGLHDANPANLKRRVYNIAGVRTDGKAPTAQNLADAVKAVKPSADIRFDRLNPQLNDTVKGFGVLDDTAAVQDWEWGRVKYDLPKLAADFQSEVLTYPDRIKATELFGA
jgi:nucleoside-diphosphate-sugar epimerase